MKNKTWKKWTKEDNEQLIELAKTHTKTEIAQIMEGRTISSIQNRLAYLGISCKSEQNGAWSEEEIEQLTDLSDNYTKSGIAKKMKRSASSINGKRQHIELSGSLLDRTDKWNFNQIAYALGLSIGVVNKTFVKYGLKFRRRGYYCLVKEEDLLKFMKTHPELWNAAKADYYLFCQYPWFLEKLEQDKKVPVEHRGYYWTDYQKQQFDILKRRGYTHKQIAEVIGKTKKAVDQYSSAQNKKR